MIIREIAETLYRQGINVVPVRKDGSKAPAVPKYKQFYDNRINVQTFRSFFSKWEGTQACGIGVLCGAVSNNLVVIDIDCKDVIEPFESRVREQLPEVWDRLIVSRTGSGKRHYTFFCDDDPGAKYVAKSKDGDGLIEWRANKCHTVTVGTPGYCHKNGKPYERISGPDIDDVQTLGGDDWRELRLIVENFHQEKRPTPDRRRSRNGATRKPRYSASVEFGGTIPDDINEKDCAIDLSRPGDHFCVHGDWDTHVFGPLKYELVKTEQGHPFDHQYFRRPGSDNPHSIKTGLESRYGRDVCHVFSDNCEPLNQEHTYNKLEARAHLYHHGSIPEAVAWWAKQQRKAEQIRQVTDENDSGKPSGYDDGTFPSNLLQVPGFVGEVLQHTLDTAHVPQPVLSLAGALALLATLLGNRVSCVQRNYTNLAVIMVAGTGAGKNRPREVNNEILLRCDAIHMTGCENPASGPAILRVLETDPVQLMQIDEFGRFLTTAGDPRSNAHGILTEILKLYTSCGQTIRKPYADTNDSFEIQNPLVVLLGATTPDALFEAVTNHGLRDGFLPRVDFFVGDDDAVQQEGIAEWKQVSGSIVRVARQYLDLGDDQPGATMRTPVRLRYSQAARRTFDEMKRYVKDQRKKSSVAAEVWTRAARKAAAFAILHAMSADPKAKEIGEDSMSWGCEIQKFLTGYMCEYLAKWCSANPFDREQKAILRRVIDNGGWITLRNFNRSFHQHDANKRDRLLENLLTTGFLREVEVPTKGKAATVFYDPRTLDREGAAKQYRRSRKAKQRT